MEQPSNVEESKNLPNVLACDRCGGLGVQVSSANEQPCEACHGIGKGMVVAGTVVYWDLPLSVGTILERKAERTARAMVNAMMFGMGIVGLGSLGYGIFLFLNNEGARFIQDLLFLRSPWFFVFWVSVIADAYVFYRLEVETQKRVTVVPWSFRSTLATVSSFRDLWTTDKRQRQELSAAMTSQAVHALEEAWMLAHRLGHAEVRPIHLLVALTQFQEIGAILARLSLTAASLEPKFRRLLTDEKIPKGATPVLSSAMHDLLLYAYEEASQTRQPMIDVTELLVVIARTHANAAEMLYDLEIDLSVLRNMVSWINFQKQFRKQYQQQRVSSRRKPKTHMNRAMTARPTPLLDRMGRDLTLIARSGGFFPMVGRRKQIEEVLRVFEEGAGNVLLIGDAGVGKSAIVEGLADLMASEEVPAGLQDKRLVELNVGALLGSGANVESTMTMVINEMLLAGNVVLFIDDLANLLGAGSTSSGTLDAAMVLQQELTRGRIAVMATSTRQNYVRYLQNQDALMRRFQQVTVPEMDDNDAIQTVEAHSAIFESKHSVFFSYQAIEAAVKLSRKYLHDRYLPDKALRIAEETAVYVARKGTKNTFITADDVATIISEKTNIRVTRVARDEQELLLHLEEKIHERIVGQDDAVRMVAESLRRARTQLRDQSRPIVNLLFLGPTGVGKTQLAKTTASIYFGAETNMIRLDMSEYQDQASLSRLIGAAPGYAGASEGGQLTDAVRQHPFSLVLLDEFEKAHPDIVNIFLQVMDDGRLTDSSGRLIDFTNTMIIATSNAGTSEIQEGIRQGKTHDELHDELMNTVLKKHFRPELLNRFDGIVVFKPLEFEQVVQIAGLLFDDVAKQMLAKGILLKAEAPALRELAQAGFDPTLGARPLRRAIQDTIDASLSRLLLENKISRRDIVVLESGGVLRVRKAQAL